MRVEIRKRAFAGIIISAVEVFKRETSGILLGEVEDGVLVIKNVIPCQTSTRSFGYFNFHKKSLRRALEVVEALYPKIGHDFLGYYHSHPEYGEIKFKPKPSKKGDRSWILEEGGNKLFVIVAIRAKKRNQPWRLSKDRVLFGTIASYRFDISVYFRASQRRIIRAKISFPDFLRVPKARRNVIRFSRMNLAHAENVILCAS